VTRKCFKHDHIWKYDKNLHDCQTSHLTDFATRGADLLRPFNKTSKRKISSYFGGERNEETEEDKDQDDLRVEEAEGDGNMNPKVAKTSNESRNFQAKWLKEHTWLRYENQAMFCHFCRLGKKENPFASDKCCSNFKTTTLFRHVSSHVSFSSQ